MQRIDQWAARWGVPAAALQDLYYAIGLEHVAPPVAPPVTAREAWSQATIRLEAPRKGCTLWRNNVGVLKDINGRPVRYGLANESPDMNDRVKSGDLIGWRSLVIEPRHVGARFAQFVSREAKAPGWKFRGDKRELAQLAWANLVNAAGGDAAFATGEGTL